MNKVDVIRAWKDPLYRATLSAEDLARLPAHPAGAIELKDHELREATGGLIETTFKTCTQYTYISRCCH
ncbi:MAG TPA: mersacidin/lichenicidin family type 2 lantibiotic [Thermoanaerobaculia bacterium]|nr:mersacidin/lichenicidin family type 2 lantibiotic [Thermoanaerobaculia bacterium]